jgi:hypothetical protein
MKKATSSARAAPSAASLHEMPEIDFTRYHIRRNPYASVIAREGISVIHDEPSARSLADVPEVDLAREQARRNPYALRARQALAQLKAGRGRPKRGEEIGPTPARSIRLPMPVWEALEEAARNADTTVHALLRLAVTHLLETPRFDEHLLAASGPKGRRPRRRAPKPRLTPGPERRASPRRRAVRPR